MSHNCPNSKCPYYKKSDNVISDGSYFRKNDSRKIKRLKCSVCKKRFSLATNTLEVRQKKRRVNDQLRNLLCSGVSMRRSAIILRVARMTITRKLNYLAKKARIAHQDFLKELSLNPIENVQFDDLISSEHTKLKPLTLSIAVSTKTRHILGVQVGRIPSFGKLAKLSLKKYGKRKCRHKETLKKLFREISPAVSQHACLESDKHTLYPALVKKFFQFAEHKTYEGGRAAITGQGELKKIKYDPLFTLNHSCAMLRANINRLFRKTWCTTKDPLMLKNHIDIFIQYYNTVLVKPSKS